MTRRLIFNKIMIAVAMLGFMSGGLNPLMAGPTDQSVALGSNLERWNLPSRSIGVGGAYSADANGLQGGLTNPASLSRLQSYQFSVEHQNWQNQWNLFNTGLAVPMYGGHAMAVTGTWLDYGELKPLDPNETFRPQGNEFKGGLTYSYRLDESSAIGFSGGMMTSKIGFRDREYKPYLDLGYLLRLTPDLWFGLTARNLVGDLTVDTGPDKLPSQYRAGLVWSWWEDRLAMTGDVVYHDPESSSGGEDDSFGGAGGIRFQIYDHFRLSTGYHNYYDSRSGLTGGLQIEYPNFQWKFSFMDTGEDNLLRIGGNMRF